MWSVLFFPFHNWFQRFCASESRDFLDTGLIGQWAEAVPIVREMNLCCNLSISVPICQWNRENRRIVILFSRYELDQACALFFVCSASFSVCSHGRWVNLSRILFLRTVQLLSEGAYSSSSVTRGSSYEGANYNKWILQKFDKKHKFIKLRYLRPFSFSMFNAIKHWNSNLMNIECYSLNLQYWKTLRR